ncbi:glycosyltransferase family 1 protein [Chryseobacterium gleum]|uniref:glycosyltransferase family 1 protein n=1 Tax=Chryseobacterium gleum TaxID=250 RepID=UPI001039D6F6|nr:glycosyltransferase family 1 protein [Chryseobacterium gleum]QBJ86873.1 glycosyltransferase family 1 protein [Chryseobacterium gleum]
MKIIFHENQLCYRGTSNALFDYAYYNEEMLGNESMILYPKNSPNNVEEAIGRFKKRFNVVSYSDVKERDEIIKKANADVFYAIKSGEKETDTPQDLIKTVIHAVFKYNEPYGDVYAYVSEWLAKTMSNGALPFVPHIIDLPEVDDDLRAELNIPKDAVVFARYGGAETFDIGFVMDAVKKTALKNKKIYFIFMGTDEFIKRNFFRSYKNIIFLPPTTDVERRVKFINAADAFLHARTQGESFGMAIGEFSIKNKPVITWSGSDEKSHLEILGDKGILYKDKEDIMQILNSFTPDNSKNWDCYSEQFNPRVVMEKFQNVFLK